MAERLRRLSKSQKKDKVIAKRARSIDLHMFFTGEDLDRLLQATRQVLGPVDADEFLSRQVVRFGRLPQNDPRRVRGEARRILYMEEQVSRLLNPSTNKGKPAK